MAEKYPYMSGSAGLVQAVAQLRKSFPLQVAADTLKKLGIAPNNETYVLNTLRFVGVIDAADQWINAMDQWGQTRLIKPQTPDMLPTSVIQ